MTNPRDAQTAPEPIIMVDGDKVFGPGKAPDSYVRYMIDDSRFPAWHGCMTHYDRAATPARAGMGAVVVAARKFLNDANSAWAAGEPLHMVRTMLDAADDIQAALDALQPGEAQPAPRDDVPAYGEQERVEVRLDDDGNPSFFFSSREGWEDLGPELRMAADAYAVGTKITLVEPLK